MGILGTNAAKAAQPALRCLLSLPPLHPAPVSTNGKPIRSHRPPILCFSFAHPSPFLPLLFFSGLFPAKREKGENPKEEGYWIR